MTIGEAARKHWRAASVALLALGAGGFFVIDMFERPAAPGVARDATTSAPSQPQQGVVPSGSVAMAKPTVAPTQPAPAATSVLWPEPEKPIVFKATSDPLFGDPFDGDGGRPHDVRELTRVGRTRLGVTNDSKMKDEKAVIAVLNQLGAEIDEKEKGRTDDFERRVLEYQPIFQRYRAKLAPHMEGSFAVKGGDGWTDTERILHPHAGDAAPHAP